MRVSLLLGAALLAGACTPERQPVERPDVFVIVIDTLRADRLGCYGYERATSPFLDRLAREGARFADNTAQCSWTKPSMVSLFSGRYVTSYQDVFAAGVPTLAETFAAAGYRTIGVVGNVLLSKEAAFDRGFAHYDARELSALERAERKAAGGSAGPCRTLDTMRVELAVQLADEMKRRKRGEREPLFVYLHPMDPHAPYDRRPQYQGELPVLGAAPRLPSEWHADRARELGRDPASEAVAAEWHGMNVHRGRYDWEVRFTDDQLALLFETLAAGGLLDDAIVAVVADHGEELFDHLELMTRRAMEEKPLRKVFQQEHGHNLYRPLVGTPFLLWGRGVPAGRVVEAPVENVDLFPTLLELADIGPPEGLQGRSLVPCLADPALEEARDVHSFVMYATLLREGSSGLSLVLPSKLGERKGAVPLLVDLGADPQERVNLYDERPDDVARLTALMDAWRERHPNETTIARSKDPATMRNMRALGYFGEDDE